MLALLAAMVVGMWFWRSSVEETTHPEVDYSRFYEWVEAGRVESVVLRGTQLDGSLKQAQQIPQGETTTFHTILPSADEQLMPLLREKQVKVRVKTGQQPFAVELVLGLLPWALILGVWIWLGRRAQRMMGGGGPLGSMLKSKSRKFEKTESVNVTFEDVAGLNSAKRDLREIVQFLQEPDQFRRLGGKVPRGVLLVGPPGTGKTLLARAVAGESGVPFFSIPASDFVGMFGGVGRIRDEIAFEGTLAAVPDESAEWVEYSWKCKPGDPDRRPCWISPYHLRLDWLVWFAAMSEYRQHPWLVHLALKLLQADPGALALLA